MNSSVTKICCIIGNPVAHSLSPAMHNAAYKKLGLDFIYFALPVADLAGAFNALKLLGVRGIAVTVPYKEKVLGFADRIDSHAAKIGAANTLLNVKGKFMASNTDWSGAARALEEITGPGGKTAVIRGAGGAARAVAYGLKNRKARVLILNRTPSNARRLVRELNLEGTIGENDIVQMKKADILINASTLGMEKKGPLPFPAAAIGGHQVVFDIVYTPSVTPFLKLAGKRGAAVVSGWKMLLYQGLEQFKIFTGLDAPVSTFKGTLLKSLEAHKI